MKQLNPLRFLFACSALLTCALQGFGQESHINTYKYGEGINLYGKDDYHMELSGYIQPMFETKFYTDSTDNNFYNRFRIRRLRLRLAGDLPKYKMQYRLQVDLSGNSEVGDQSNLYLLDAWVAYEPIKNFKITFGQRSLPSDNRELLLSSQSLQLIERSKVTSYFSSIRDFGLFAEGRIHTGGNTYLRPYFHITSGDGKNTFVPDYGGLKIGGRLDFLPFGLFTNMGQFREGDVVREQTPKLVIGAVYSYLNGISDRRGRESGTILYLNDSNQVTLPDYIKYGADFMFKYKGFSVLGEFMGSAANVPNTITQRVRTDGTTARTFEVDGEDNMENYVKSRLMLGKGYNIQAGYLFKSGLSIDARYTHIESDKYSFFTNGTFYNRPNYYTLGVTQYFKRGYGFKVQASITYQEVTPGSNNIYAEPITGNEWVGRIGTTFSF